MQSSSYVPSIERRDHVVVDNALGDRSAYIALHAPANFDTDTVFPQRNCHKNSVVPTLQANAPGICDPQRKHLKRFGADRRDRENRNLVMRLGFVVSKKRTQ